jgi:hypothetical protein
MLPQSYSTKSSRRTRRVPAPRLSQPVDGLEGSVLLNDGEEDLGWRIPHLRSDGDDASADIEPADLVDGPQQAGTGRVRPRQFESGGRKAARQISLQRNEARWQGGIEGRLGGLVVGDDLERGVPRKRHHLGNDDAFAGGLPPERLEIEITESVLLERALENRAFIERLKSLGVSLALDDFGTGYSSLGSLTAFPFNKIKIESRSLPT